MHRNEFYLPLEDDMLKLKWPMKDIKMIFTNCCITFVLFVGVSCSISSTTSALEVFISVFDQFFFMSLAMESSLDGITFAFTFIFESIVFLQLIDSRYIAHATGTSMCARALNVEIKNEKA